MPQNSQNLTISVTIGNSDMENEMGPISIGMNIVLKKSPESRSTNVPAIPDVMMPMPMETSHSVNVETVLSDHPSQAPSIATRTMSQITTLNFSVKCILSTIFL